MTKRTRSWFFQGGMTTFYRRFLQNNRPNQSTMVDLMDSVLLSEEASDSATETQAGHVRFATKAEVVAKTDTDSDGFKHVVRPSDLPDLGSFAEAASSVVDSDSNEGLAWAKMSQPTLNAIKYLLRVLIDTDYLKFNGSNEITFSDAFAELITNLSALIDPVTGEPTYDLNDFPSGIFDGGGITNVGGVLTADTDDTTLEIDAVSKKIQIKDGGITLAKIQDLTAGQVIVGPTGDGTPVVLSLLGEGNILKGTATGVEIVDLNTYLLSLAIADNQILARKINASTLGNGLTRDTAASDASQMHVDLSAAASMEFSSNKLQLKNDEASPSNKHYYGTGANSGGSPGYHPLYKNMEIVSLPFDLDGSTSVISIDVASDVLGESINKIWPLELDVKIYKLSGSGPEVYTEFSVLPVLTSYATEPYIETIDYTGLDVSSSYYVVISFHRRPVIM